MFRRKKPTVITVAVPLAITDEMIDLAAAAIRDTKYRAANGRLVIKADRVSPPTATDRKYAKAALEAIVLGGTK